MARVQAIGDRLREARMRQKIDIADVESATKIRAKYLRALENEEFGLLPGPTFVKTFLRTYAEYLGLDAQLLVEEYRVGHEPRGEEFAPIAAARGGRSARGRRGGPRMRVPGPGAVFAAILVLLVAVILVLGITGDNKDNGSGSSTTTTRQAGDGTTDRTRKPSSRSGSGTSKPPTVVRLRLAPVEPTYACVVDGSGRQLFGGTMSSPKTFRAKRIRINIGRTSMKVTVGKRALRIPAGSNPVGYDLRPGRTPKPLALGQRPNC
jgi:cytoskeleton protein RodZ